jgi:hypothetical protein
MADPRPDDAATVGNSDGGRERHAPIDGGRDAGRTGGGGNLGHGRADTDDNVGNREGPVTDPVMPKNDSTLKTQI